MKKILTLILLLKISVFAFASPMDSTTTDTIVTAKHKRFHTELTLASRNLYRGVSFGHSPSIQMLAYYSPCPYLQVGTYGQATLNGTQEGYGNQLNLYASIIYKKISITVYDFYFFNSNDKDDDYFNWGSNFTQHFIEAGIKYDSRLDLTAAYTVYQNHNYLSKNTWYFEAGYDVTDILNVFAGYVTNASSQMFYENSGITSTGATVSRTINITPTFTTILKTSLIFNPNYKAVSDIEGVNSKQAYLVVSLTF